MDPNIKPGRSLLDLDDDSLYRNRVRVYQDDKSYRDDEYKVDFETASRLYEAGSGDTDEAGIPRVNMIRRAVEDHVSVASANVPKARLVGERAMPGLSGSPGSTKIAGWAMDQAEETFNGMVMSVLVDNDYPDLKDLAIRQSGVFGVGYLKIEIDRTADTRKSIELRELIRKGLANWTERDASRFAAIANRISISHVHAPLVFWQGGVRRVGPDMLRVSELEYKDTHSLRVAYKNPDIRPGRDIFDLSVEEANPDELTSTAILTTWELVPITKRLFAPAPEPEFAPFDPEQAGTPGGVIDMENPVEGEPLARGFEFDAESVSPTSMFSVEVTDWVMLKTVIGGGQLLSRKSWDSTKGPICLPLVPWYMRESEKHPYGYSLPEALELSERFINRVRTLIYQSALKSISPQAMVGMVQELSKEDAAAINEVLVKGGFANIRLNDTNRAIDIKDVIQPVITNNPGVSNALVQAMQHEESAFQTQSASVDINQIARAESGAAKRAQLAAFDRPKTLTLGLLSRSVEMVWDTIWENIRSTHQSENMPVTSMAQTGQRQRSVLNQRYQRTIPVFDDENEPITGVDGQIEMEDIDIMLNDTSMTMKAEAEGRGTLPIDMVQRFMVLNEFRSGGLIKSLETMRDIVLDPAIKSRDDANWQKEIDNARKNAATQMTPDTAGEQSLDTGNLSGAGPQIGGSNPQLYSGDSLQDQQLAPTQAETLADLESS